MRILIVGGTGLISTAITRLLVERGDEVILFNRGKSSTVPPGVTALVGDRNDSDQFEGQIRTLGQFDCVIDMICFTPEQAQSSIRTFSGKTEQFILCSTTDVYTKPAKWYPITENHERNPSPSFPYAYNKAVCELLFEGAHSRGDFEVTIIRPAQTYGGPIHTFRGDMHVIGRIREGKPIILHGDGRSLWCACHRDDVARTFVTAVCNPRTYGNSYHVTGEEWMTWDQYWTEIAEIMNAPKPRFVHIPTDIIGEVWPNRVGWCVENFQYNNIFDNSAAKRDLGFEYSICWRDGMSLFLKEFNEHSTALKKSPDYYDLLIDYWGKLTQKLKNEIGFLDSQHRDL